MAITKYEQHKDKLDIYAICREIPASGPVMARGVSAPHEGTATPCVVATFDLNEPDLQYVFTDGLTGCAGLIAVSGDGDYSEQNNVFNASSALVIHDKGGDYLASSKKLLEDFFVEQRNNGHTRMRLIWGNGIVPKGESRDHAFETQKMVYQLVKKYPHLEVKHLPEQITLLADKNGNPINLSETSLCDVATMETIWQHRTDIDLPNKVDVKFETHFRMEFEPPQTEVNIPNPIDQIDNALNRGKFPPIWLLQSNPNMKSYLDRKTAQIPMSGADADWSDKFKNHPLPLLQDIGRQLDKYKKEYTQSRHSALSNPDKAQLKSRKWWAMAFLATEIKDAYEAKESPKARIQLFGKDFYKEWLENSMDGLKSTAASLVEKAATELIITEKIKVIDGMAQMKQTEDSESKTFSSKP